MTNSIFKYLAIAVLFGVMTLIYLWAGLWIWGSWNGGEDGYDQSVSISDGICNIAVLPLFGEIISYPGANKDGTTYIDDLPPTVNPDDVEYLLSSSERDERILGVLAEIDSTGGAGSAGISIANRLKRSTLPTAALVRESADSAAYMIATGVDTIIASPFSDIGSIGVTMSYLDNSEQNTLNGLKLVSLSSGKFKDSGIPDKPLSAEERTLFERDLATWHDAFVTMVGENRNIPKEEVVKLADGSSMAASLALEHKLIDALGDRETARAWFSKELSIPLEEVVFCQ